MSSNKLLNQYQSKIERLESHLARLGFYECYQCQEIFNTVHACIECSNVFCPECIKYYSVCRHFMCVNDYNNHKQHCHYCYNYTFNAIYCDLCSAVSCCYTECQDCGFWFCHECKSINCSQKSDSCGLCHLTLCSPCDSFSFFHFLPAETKLKIETVLLIFNQFKHKSLIPPRPSNISFLDMSLSMILYLFPVLMTMAMSNV